MSESKFIAWKSALQSCPLFADLPDAEIQSVLDITTAKSAHQGEYLFREGEPVEGFYLVRVGAVRVQRTAPSGKEKVIHVFRKGDTFGEGTLMMDYYPVDALAIRTTDLLHFSRNGYVKLLETKREFALRTIVSLSQHLKQLVDHIEKDRETDAPCRVATWLLERCATPTVTSPCMVDLKIPKAALADELHMRSETLSRSLKKLGENELIAVRGSSVTINNPKVLSDFVAKRRRLK